MAVLHRFYCNNNNNNNNNDNNNNNNNLCFKWKGENVSTTEVSNTLTDLEFVHDANVYGILVPGEFPCSLNH